jgi:hypothetical protein
MEPSVPSSSGKPSTAGARPDPRQPVRRWPSVPSSSGKPLNSSRTLPPTTSTTSRESLLSPHHRGSPSTPVRSAVEPAVLAGRMGPSVPSSSGKSLNLVAPDGSRTVYAHDRCGTTRLLSLIIGEPPQLIVTRGDILQMLQYLLSPHHRGISSTAPLKSPVVARVSDGGLK